MRPVPTPRLLLEPQLASHAPAMFALLSDPALYLHEDAPPESLAALARRYERLASRRSADGREHWLNWVLRQHSDAALVGYVQATVLADGRAWVAYVLGSGHWGRGLATEAVRAMLGELHERWAATQALAVFKRSNLRSQALLHRLGFTEAAADDPALAGVAADEALRQRALPV